MDKSPDRAAGLRRWLRIGERVLLVLLAAHFCVRTAPRAWQTLHNDFPDYYLPAALAHEHSDTSRIYEWLWLGRQKDHHGIDQSVVNLVPSTAFSTLALYPLAGMSVLAAKRCWFLISVGLLIATIFLLRALTRIPLRRIALVAAFSFPLRLNFSSGQYYALLLFVLTLACYLYLRQRRFAAGVMVGIASGMKIFPVIYLLYFLRKRDWKAVAGGVTGGLSTVVLSVMVFGWQVNRTYFFQILPSALRGEALDAYSLKVASLSSLLHRLFIYEPQLNPHPAIDAAWLFAVLLPLLQMMVMAPALLLADPGKAGEQRIRLEWSAILLASMAISTSPQSYLFTLLILPVCLILEALQSERAYRWIVLLASLYVGTGYLSGAEHGGEGWSALLGVPRLCAMMLACTLTYALLMRSYAVEGLKRERYAWAVGLSAVVALGIAGNLRHQRGLYDDYRWRVPTPEEAYMAVHPAMQGDALLFIAMHGDGYHAATERGGVTQFSSGGEEELAVTAAGGERWVERAGLQSTIVSTLTGRSGIAEAELPEASSDGRWLAYLKEDHGRARLWVRGLGQADGSGTADRQVTPPELNVLEMSFEPSGDIVFAATSGGRAGLFVADSAYDPKGTGSVRTWSVRSIGGEEARYPAVSPDGRWLAYSQFEDGNWNLWLRDLTSGDKQRLTHAACNTTEPAWSADSKTLVYASDCGRALWFSALCRRRVIP